MHNRPLTGLQHASKQSRKSLLLLITLALLLSAMLTLFSTIPTLASPTQPLQSQQQAILQASCPTGQIPDANGNCVALPTVTATPISTNDSIKNPLAQGSPLLFYTDLGNTINQPQVQSLWGISLLIVDLFLALILVTNGITIMLGGSVFRNAKVIEGLPGILLALIAAHVSMLFMGIFLNLNNVLSVDFYNYAQNNLKPTSGQVAVSADCQLNSAGYYCTFTDGTTTTYYGNTPQFPTNHPGNNSMFYNCTLTYGTPPGQFHPVPGQKPVITEAKCTTNKTVNTASFQITPPNLNLDAINIPSMLGNMSDALKLMLTVTALMLLAQVIVRLFYLDLYIVLAPIGIAAWALPGRVGQPLTRSWFQGFLSTVFVQFLQVVAIVVTELVLSGFASYLSSPTGGRILDGSVLRNQDLLQIINVAFPWFIMRIPALLNAAPMRGMMEVGQTMSQAAGSMISMQIMQQQLGNASALGWGTTGAGAIVGIGTSFIR